MRSPSSPLFTRLDKPCSLRLSSKGAPAPNHPGGLCWTCYAWPMEFLYRGPKTGCSSWMWLAEYEGNSCFCRPSDRAPVHTAQEAVALLCCQGTLLALLAVPWLPCSRAALQPGSPQPVVLQGALPSQAWGSRSVLAEFREGFQSAHSCSLSGSL